MKHQQQIWFSAGPAIDEELNRHLADPRYLLAFAGGYGSQLCDLLCDDPLAILLDRSVNPFFRQPIHDLVADCIELTSPPRSEQRATASSMALVGAVCPNAAPKRPDSMSTASALKSLRER